MRRQTRLRLSFIVAALAASTIAASCRALLAPVGHRIESNHTAAAARLRAYLGAQVTFRRVDRYGKGELVYANPKDGTGFTDLYRIGGPLAEPDGTELKLIYNGFARARSPETASCGYWFVDIVGDSDEGPYDYTKDCGLCAVPAVYGKSGINTFIVDITDTVYEKDTHGTPVRVWPDVEKEGWIVWD